MVNPKNKIKNIAKKEEREKNKELLVSLAFAIVEEEQQSEYRSDW